MLETGTDPSPQKKSLAITLLHRYFHLNFFSEQALFQGLLTYMKSLNQRKNLLT